MFDFHEKRKIKAWAYSWPMIIILLVPIGLLSVSVYERHQKERETWEKREVQNRELQDLKDRAAALEERVQYVKSSEGIEEEIRSRYDLAKEGEHVIVIVDEEIEEEGAPVTTEIEGRSFLEWLKFW